MNLFDSIHSLDREKRYFESLTREEKRQYLIEFDMPPTLRSYVEFEKISEFTLGVVFDKISKVQEQENRRASGF
jgi:hypothetical protein